MTEATNDSAVDDDPLGVLEKIVEECTVITDESKTAEARATSGGVDRAYLRWGCRECGESGSIESLPEACPNCSAGRESLYYWPGE